MSWFATKAEEFEKYRIGASTILITFGSTLGGAAALFAIKMHFWPLVTISAAVCMGSNAIFIANLSGKWCVGGAIVSIVTTSIVLLLSLSLYLAQ